jgi:hypothetical protein
MPRARVPGRIAARNGLAVVTLPRDAMVHGVRVNADRSKESCLSAKAASTAAFG